MGKHLLMAGHSHNGFLNCRLDVLVLLPQFFFCQGICHYVIAFRPYLQAEEKGSPQRIRYYIIFVGRDAATVAE